MPSTSRGAATGPEPTSGRELFDRMDVRQLSMPGISVIVDDADHPGSALSDPLIEDMSTDQPSPGGVGT